MKKMMSVCLLLSVLLLLAGCQSPGPEQDLGDTYVPENDNQYYFYLSGILGNPITDSEDAYYFDHEQYLYSKDKKTGKSAPLCNKPDCTHDEQAMNPDGSSNCNAYFGHVGNMAYYQGKLYVIEDEGVYEMDVSGSTRKELLQFKEIPSCGMVHRGYLYISFTDFWSAPEEYTEEEMQEMSYRVERYRLDQWDGKPEVVYEKKGEFGQINTMFAYGNRVYFVGAGESEGGVCYDILDHSVTTMPPGTNAYMALSNDHLVYFPPLEGDTGEETSEESYELQKNRRAVIADLNGKIKKETEIPETHSSLYAFGDKIAADNYSAVAFDRVAPEDRCVRFYDQNGKFIREVKTGNERLPVLGMNEDYLFYLKRGENNEGVELWAIDLHRLDDPDLQGERFFPEEQ